MKKNLLFLSFLFSLTTLLAQPMNDDCDGLIDLGIAPICPAVLDTFNNVDATASMISSNPAFEIPACFNGGTVERDVWFKFTVPGDGSIVDFQIDITGVDGPNDPMSQPQVAVYRGECFLDELQELECATAALGANQVTIDLEGLTPGLEYFLRINDWSASASPNQGDFVICIDEFDPCFIMCDAENTSDSASGKLYDSGGPDGDYSNSENCTFTICPSIFNQCIFVNVAEYALESGFDNLNFYAGMDTNAPQIFSLSGTGTDFEIQASSDCITIEFMSDVSVTNPGFFLEWSASADTCTIPPIVSCDEPAEIASLPFTEIDLSTCFAGNTVTTGPCNEFFLTGEEYIFTYESPGDECIKVDITGSSEQTGVAIYNDCPNVASECVASAGGNFGLADPTINAAFLETAGTYYIVVANANNCTGFDINVETVECPTVLPPAEDCENAVSINGCGSQPSTIAVSQMASTNLDFELGCWGGSGAAFFTWFIFQAQEDGDFGFLASNTADPFNSDIDINVWGPYTAEDLVCDGTLLDEPARSTWSGAAGVTGLIDINPETGAVVDDICEGAAGDKFVSTIPVVTGEWYVVLINDFGGDIVDGQIDMDFTFTSDGVLGPEGEAFTISSDTTLCAGEPVQLLAEGGSLFQWMDHPALSCTNCPNPIANVTETTTFEVGIFGACNSDTLSVQIAVLDSPAIDFNVNVVECSDTTIVQVTEILTDSLFVITSFDWELVVGGTTYTSTEENPDFEITETGMATLTLIASNDSGCSGTATQEFTVDPEILVLDLGPDQTLDCQTLSLILDASSDFESYIWSTTDITSSITVTEGGTYSVTVTDVCGNTQTDDVLVNEDTTIPAPDIPANVDICLGSSFTYNVADGFDFYTWTPAEGLSCTDCPSPIATPTETTIYTLIVGNVNGCTGMVSSQITISPNVTSSLDLEVCEGETIDYNGTDLAAGTIMDFNFVTAEGCDSIVTVTVTGLPNVVSTLDLSACEGETVDYNGTALAIGSTTDFIFSAGNGCDSTVTVTVLGLSNPSSTLNLSVCEGETIDYNGTALAIGSTTDFVFPAGNGCDSTVTVTVLGLSNTSSTLDLSACEGETVDYNGTALAVGSTTDFVFPAGNGCDSTVTVTVLGLSNTSSTLDLSACEGETVDYNGTTLAVGSMTDFVFPAGNGCDSTITVTVSMLPAFTSTLSLAACEGQTVTYNDSELMPGTTTDFTFQANNGCDSIVTVTVATLPNLFSSEDIAICEGESIDIFGTPVSAPGVFEMTFTGSNGCDSTHTISLTVFDAFEVVLSNTNNNCAGGLEGTATATAQGGVAPYTYLWNTGATFQTINNLSAGTYSATVTDSNGCSATGSVSVEQPANIEITTTQENVGCETFGSATVSAIGGTGALTYEWSIGSEEQSIDNLLAGEFTVTVTDENNCEMTETIVITGAFGPEITIEIEALPTVGNLMGGELDLNISGGTAPFTYLWNTGANTSSLNNLGSGLYSATITDANGCTDEASVTIFIPGCMRGRIWDDCNRDGCRDNSEPNISGIELALTGTDIFGNQVSLTTVTSGSGKYSFQPLPPGTFEISYVDFNDDEYTITTMDACSNDGNDSDFNVNTESIVYELAEGDCPTDLDGGLFDPCLNVLDAGTICCDQMLCGPGNVPNPITSLTPATGAGGPVEYMWMKNIAGTNAWLPIMGTNSPNYAPGALYETTNFARCVRAVGCTKWLETNIVQVFVGDDAVAEISGAGLTCEGDMETYTALDNGAGATYEWTFGGLATPVTATGQTVNVTWNNFTTTQITLTVTKDDCTSTNFKYVAISNSDVVCGSSFTENSEDEFELTAADDNAPQYALLTNPINDNLTVTWNKMVEGQISLELYTMSGQPVAAATADGERLEYQMSTTNLMNGLYLLHVQDENGTRETMKVFKQ